MGRQDGGRGLRWRGGGRKTESKVEAAERGKVAGGERGAGNEDGNRRHNVNSAVDGDTDG